MLLFLYLLTLFANVICVVELHEPPPNVPQPNNGEYPPQSKGPKGPKGPKNNSNSNSSPFGIQPTPPPSEFHTTSITQKCIQECLISHADPSITVNAVCCNDGKYYTNKCSAECQGYTDFDCIDTEPTNQQCYFQIEITDIQCYLDIGSAPNSEPEPESPPAESGSSDQQSTNLFWNCNERQQPMIWKWYDDNNIVTNTKSNERFYLNYNYDDLSNVYDATVSRTLNEENGGLDVTHNPQRLEITVPNNVKLILAKEARTSQQSFTNINEETVIGFNAVFGSFGDLESDTSSISFVIVPMKNDNPIAPIVNYGYDNKQDVIGAGGIDNDGNWVDNYGVWILVVCVAIFLCCMMRYYDICECGKVADVSRDLAQLIAKSRKGKYGRYGAVIGASDSENEWFQI